MSGHKTLHVAPPRSIRCQRPARQHHLQDMQQLLGHLEIRLIASVMKRDQDFVRQAAREARSPARTDLASGVIGGLAHSVPL